MVVSVNTRLKQIIYISLIEKNLLPSLYLVPAEGAAGEGGMVWASLAAAEVAAWDEGNVYPIVLAN